MTTDVVFGRSKELQRAYTRCRDSGSASGKRRGINAAGLLSKLGTQSATVTNSARFSTNDEDFFTRINQLLLDNQKKIVIIACIELDIAGEKEHKARMSVWMQKLKQKLAWLHAAKISINPIENISAVLPDTEILFV